LQIEITFSGGSKQFERDITDVETTIYLPVSEMPERISIDPRLTLLAESKETKSQQLWENQLTSGVTVAERIRAVEHFSEKKEPRSVELLRGVLTSDVHYGVRVEAASALGKIGRDDARDGLLAAIDVADPKVRRACVEALS